MFIVNIILMSQSDNVIYLEWNPNYIATVHVLNAATHLRDYNVRKVFLPYPVEHTL